MCTATLDPSEQSLVRHLAGWLSMLVNSSRVKCHYLPFVCARVHGLQLTWAQRQVSTGLVLTTPKYAFSRNNGCCSFLCPSGLLSRDNVRAEAHLEVQPKRPVLFRPRIASGYHQHLPRKATSTHQALCFAFTISDLDWSPVQWVDRGLPIILVHICGLRSCSGSRTHLLTPTEKLQHRTSDHVNFKYNGNLWPYLLP